MKIGETILKLREEKKMSQEEFAQYYHVTRQTISNWEKEKNYPDLQTLVKISDESGVPLDSMLKDNFSMVQENRNNSSIGDSYFSFSLYRNSKRQAGPSCADI